MQNKITALKIAKRGLFTIPQAEVITSMIDSKNDRQIDNVIELSHVGASFNRIKEMIISGLI